MPNITNRIGFFAVTATALLALAAPALASGDFNSIVRTILNHQTSGALADMQPAQRARMTDCVVQALQPLPSGFKRQIVEGKTLAEQEHAFGVW